MHQIWTVSSSVVPPLFVVATLVGAAFVSLQRTDPLHRWLQQGGQGWGGRGPEGLGLGGMVTQGGLPFFGLGLQADLTTGNAPPHTTMALFLSSSSCPSS